MSTETRPMQDPQHQSNPNPKFISINNASSNNPNPKSNPIPLPRSIGISNNANASGVAATSSSSSSLTSLSLTMLGNSNASRPFIREEAAAAAAAAAAEGGPHHHNSHRRAHSEVSFRLPEDMMDLSAPDQSKGGSSTASLEEMGSEEDLFSTYIDLDKLGGCNCSDQSGGGNNGPSGGPDDGSGGPNVNDGGGEGEEKRSSRHRHSCSVDGSSTSTGVFGEVMEAKKAMPPDKLAELWNLDPKRAKRILANRQSAARSKERKARYIQELERKVQTLQTEATTLSAQLTLFQRDTTGLSTENTELKLRLQAMEQQAQLRDALNEALKKEVERLKIATGEMMSPSDSFNLGMHQMPYNHPSAYFPLQQQPGPAGHQNMQMPQFNHSQSNMPTHHLHQSNSHTFSDIMQNGPVGQLQGLDIGTKGAPLVKSEGPSLSASESSTTF